MHVWVGQQHFHEGIFIVNAAFSLSYFYFCSSRSSGQVDQKFQVKMTLNYSEKTSIHIIKKWRKLLVSPYHKIVCFPFQSVIWFIYVMTTQLWSSHGTPKIRTNLSRNLLFVLIFNLNNTITRKRLVPQWLLNHINFNICFSKWCS